VKIGIHHLSIYNCT